MSVYNLHSDGENDHHIITKWDNDGNIEASYSVSMEGCTCPAGHRHTCRHRQMLPDLLPLADTHWFLDWDNGRRIVDFDGTPKALVDQLDQLPDGVQMFNLAETSPAELFNAIAEAVGEPTSPPKAWRRL